MAQENQESVEYRVLSSLRRIIRAVHMYSKKLNSLEGLTTPQLICLQAVVQREGLTLSELSKEVSLSASTLTGIVDRLEKKQLIQRERSVQDRRKVLLKPLPKGSELVVNAPSLLQDKLARGLADIGLNKSSEIADSLEQIVALMEAEDIDASPNLIAGISPAVKPAS